MKRYIAALLTAACMTGFLVGASSASDFPNRTITIVVPFGAGGSATDILARILAEKMRTSLGQPVIVENKPGAGGAIGSISVRNDPADGYHILLATTGTMIQRPIFNKEPVYHASEFEPIARIAYISPFTLIAPNANQANTFAELVRYIREHDTSYGYGNNPSLLAAAEMLDWKGLKGVAVGYQTEGKALQEGIFTGQLDWMFLSIPISKSHIVAKKVKVYAQMGAKRHPALPDVPTIGELGAPELTQRASWLGFFGPKGLPQPIVSRISDALQKALEDPEVQHRLASLDLETSFAPSSEFTKIVLEDDAYFSRRISDLRRKKLIAAMQ